MCRVTLGVGWLYRWGCVVALSDSSEGQALEKSMGQVWVCLQGQAGRHCKWQREASCDAAGAGQAARE